VTNSDGFEDENQRIYILLGGISKILDKRKPNDCDESDYINPHLILNLFCIIL